MSVLATVVIHMLWFGALEHIFVYRIRFPSKVSHIWSDSIDRLVQQRIIFCN
jgi:hypothetical protein